MSIEATATDHRHGERQREHDQRQSPFFDRFPREIRDAIYLELWRAAGLSQHVFWHGYPENARKSKYCSWPCTAEFQVEDECERELEVLWRENGSPQFMHDLKWHARLHSHWYNHWRCEEHLLGAYEQAGLAVDRYERSSTKFNCPCQLNDILPRRPYLPMLLTCKRMYFECVPSIYKSTRFVFVGPHVVQNLFGPCVSEDGTVNSSVSFLRHVKNLEVSLPITFPMYVPCGLASSSAAGPHSAYDFHWLHLSEMKSCENLNIWIDSRHRGTSSHSYYRDVIGHLYAPITELDSASLQQAFLRVGTQTARCSVTISTPLGMTIGPEIGFAESVQHLPRVHIWKRHSGDKFYPLPSYGGANPKGLICIIPQRVAPLTPGGMRIVGGI